MNIYYVLHLNFFWLILINNFVFDALIRCIIEGKRLIFLRL